MMPITANCHHTQPVFILCIGAPKTGTTWFYNYLNSFECTDLGFKKEYHIFDAAYLEVTDHCRPNKNRAGSSSKSGFRRKQEAQEKRLEQFRDNHDEYYDYFASLYSDIISISADITPSYMGLPVEVLSLINHEFKSRGIQTKVVFFMRDPVSRIISSAKMAQRVGIYAGKRFNRDSHIDEILKELCKLPTVIRNSNYQDTLHNLDSVFDQQNIHIGIYETMFSKHELERLSSFIGLQSRPDWLDKYFNRASTPEDEDIQTAFTQSFKQLLSEQYSYCFDRYPELANIENWSKHAESIA
ncbi:sulfotransferase domain-containing protein [Solemya velum gill symbiont]|uniref:sulfotransferase domain-containing protein n=1 Tax=Solemya velum gill symbiont TaxID=2340 RepID=UPI000997517A|nr:sulfotransferase domain-containing protein [Solemya velum gill symbiont]OOZ00102.1 hypothetical protein BOW19_01135 [Solemya velum gill symbiont]OOZ02262.1 hypothetical protein BOW20_01130 [Solemya velum gill symbiont]OOZ04620.1 hypothetical protein BOW21_01140 [Solemya velum gill symbiont]OOZ06860.1 hypothetical protein BOW22_01125 [Solemya velum gill symbiont]OOZ09042.1 hypothetical protein BOW23_01120 [Solemya velum gill symbiont]